MSDEERLEEIREMVKRCKESGATKAIYISWEDLDVLFSRLFELEIRLAKHKENTDKALKTLRKEQEETKAHYSFGGNGYETIFQAGYTAGWLGGCSVIEGKGEK